MGKSIDFCHLLLLLLLCFLVLPQQGSSSSLFDRNKDTEETVASIKQEQDHSHEVHCSRERSRAAWKVIEEYLMPFVEQEKYQITRKCLLHAENDMFRDQEQHKVHMDINDWQCGYCKKSFRAEKFLDQHFDNRHYNLLNISQSKCLADLCGALHCDLVMDSKLRKTKCNPAAASRNRHLCESLANNCFPSNAGPSASHLHELFLRQFCDSHTCTGGKKPFSRGGKKRTSIFYLAISILTLMLVPLFYCIVYLHQMDKRKGVQDLRRISNRNKSKPS
ncbi:zinc finger (C2H2 type) family protein [Thalictrum thalictroides]|uniref:Zinc finger (C2H2 type) family protein n=1 Tax=Thalictrum thalictroides TaxID=46969 RepID=A0A7J6VGS5_THATH|nr:zinc finger (C2H2 type) family protein [Thalictrum thalictroides]